MSDSHHITTAEQLESLYGQPVFTALDKEVDHITPHYRQIIGASPFVVLSTVGPEGTDCSPRGDPPGFVQVLDDRRVALPDRPGNNRIDSLRNIVRDPRVSLLFLIPGMGETLRINGEAVISTAPDLMAGFAIRGKLPKSVLVVTVDRIYFQCQKALVRSRLWQADAQVDRASLPSAGDIIKELTSAEFDNRQYDADYPERMKRTIY